MAGKSPKKTIKDEREKKTRRGRPTELNEGMIRFALYLLRHGLTHKETAKELGIAETTLYAWRKKYPELKKVMEEEKEKFDDEVVVNALYQRATGYEHRDTKFFCHEGMVITEDYVKHYPPDTKAIEFWLSNRQPDKWSRKISVENDLTKLDDDKLIELARDVLKGVEELENPNDNSSGE